MRYTEHMTKPDRTTVDIKELRERITAVSALPELADCALSSVLRILVTKGLESCQEPQPKGMRLVRNSCQPS